MAWLPQSALNMQDLEGFTPLHLAVKSVEGVGSTRPVRYLLLRGAKTDIKDKKGRLPIDMVRELRNPIFKLELTRMLVRFSCNNIEIERTK